MWSGKRRRSRKLQTAFTVRIGHHHHVTVGIAKPDLLVSGTKVGVRLLNNLGAQAARSRHNRLKIVDLEPEQDTMPGWGCVCVDEVGMVFLVPGVQLKKQPA